MLRNNSFIIFTKVNCLLPKMKPTVWGVKAEVCLVYGLFLRLPLARTA